MTLKNLTNEEELGFTTWTNSNEQFGKYPFNEYRIDLSEVISLSPDLLDSVLTARANLQKVNLLDDSDVFGD